MKSLLLVVFASAVLADYPNLPPGGGPSISSSPQPKSAPGGSQQGSGSPVSGSQIPLGSGAYSLPPLPPPPQQQMSQQMSPQQQMGSFAAPQQVPYSPDVPGFYFNAGFNKGLGIRFPSAGMVAPSFPPVAEPFAAGRTPLGDLLSAKAELLPAIFKVGFFITLFILLVKFIAAIFHAKAALLSGLTAGPAAAGVAGTATTVPVPVSPAVATPVAGSTGVHVASATLTATDAMSKSNGKREKRGAFPDPYNSGSPVVDSGFDLDQLAAKIASYI